MGRHVERRESGGGVDLGDELGACLDHLREARTVLQDPVGHALRPPTKVTPRPRRTSLNNAMRTTFISIVESMLFTKKR